jgi:hypothetical protein
MCRECVRCRATRSNAKKKLFFAKSKIKNSKIEKRKKKKGKKSKAKLAGNFELRKTHRGSKDDVIFPPASIVEKSGPT